MTNRVWVDEVLFRGRHPDSTDSPRFHVVFGVETLNPLTGNPQTAMVGPMTANEAENYGYTPIGIVDQINIEAFKRITELEQRIAELENLQS